MKFLVVIMTLSLLTWNVRGLLHGTEYINQIISQNVDVVALQEHWLPPDKLHHLHSLSNVNLITYNCMKTTSSHSRGSHGLAILVNTHSRVVELDLKNISPKFYKCQEVLIYSLSYR